MNTSTVQPLSEDLTNTVITSTTNNPLPSSLRDYQHQLLADDLWALTGPTLENSFLFYVIVFPVIAFWGIIGNVSAIVICCCTLRSRSSETGSMAVFFIGTQLVTDCIYLVCFILQTMPAALLLQHKTQSASQSIDLNSDRIRRILDISQTLFIRTSTLGELAFTASFLVLVAMLGEQHIAVKHPKWLARTGGAKSAAKVILTIANACLFGQMVTFFKYVHLEVFVDKTVGLRFLER